MPGTGRESLARCDYTWRRWPVLTSYTKPRTDSLIGMKGLASMRAIYWRNGLVKVGEGFEREMGPDSHVGLDLGLHLVVGEGEHFRMDGGTCCLEVTGRTSQVGLGPGRQSAVHLLQLSPRRHLLSE